MLSLLAFETACFFFLVLPAAATDHSQSDCFACAILTHGEEGVIYATDGTIPITDVVEPFKGHNCRSLIGKPKLFFIQVRMQVTYRFLALSISRISVRLYYTDDLFLVIYLDRRGFKYFKRVW